MRTRAVQLGPSLALGALLALALAVAPGCRKSGPAVSWRARIGDVFDVVGAGDGLVLALGDEVLVALRDGKELWTAPVPKHEGWVLPLAAQGCALVALRERGELTCRGLADGAEKWKASLARIAEPTPAPAPDAPPSREAPAAEPPAAYAAALAASGDVVLVLSDDRWATLAPATCAAGQPCLVASPAGAVRSSSSFDVLALGADGLRILNRLENLRLYDAQGKRLVTIDGSTVYFAVAGRAGEVLAGIDDAIVRIAVGRCQASEEAIAVGSAPGCVERLATAKDPYLGVVVEGDLVFVSDRSLRRAGSKTWTAAGVDAVGVPVLWGDLVVTACWRDTDDLFVSQADLCAVSAEDGRLRWRSKPELERKGLLADPVLLLDGDWLYAHFEGELVALRMPR